MKSGVGFGVQTRGVGSAQAHGVLMKKLGIAVAIAIAAVGGAHAADLPTNKEVPPPPPVNCFSSLWTYLNSSPADCPLSYAGFTVYATIDAGLGYSSNGAPFNGSYANGVYSFVGKQSYGSKWLWTPNGISQSVVGINMKEPIPWFPGWSLVGALETGIRPLFRQPRQRSTLARAEQRPGARPAERKQRLKPRRPIR